MAADQRKKPVTTVRSVVNRQDQGRVKKKNLGLFPSARSNVVSLEWDDKNNSVVAKKEQIGLLQRHLIQFGSSDFHCPTVLADTLSLPEEVFELDIVKEVLSYEVWKTLLSDNERQYLMQFLPEGVDLQDVVQELLVADSNFHFGNPFLKWSASLCSGNLHPDFILHQEHCIRARKKTYYSGLLKYHNGMINNLLMWKEKWSTSNNPEEEIVEKMWRSRKKAGNMSSDVKENIPNTVQEGVAGTSDSGSSAADDAGGNDNQNSVSRHRKLQPREVILENGNNDIAAGLKMVERPKIGERLHKQNIQRCDGSKYMSYIKISRKQHERVKSSMKHSGNSIQSRSLNRVLGNLHSFQIQPFEVFEEEEQKKLHAHWLQLAITDVPAAFANFRRWQLAKSRLPHYWKQEMEEKLVSLNKAEQDEEKEYPRIMSPLLVDNSASSNETADAMEIEETKQSDCLLEEHPEDRAYDDKLIIPSEAVKKDKIDCTGDEMMDNESALQQDSQFALASMQNQQQKITELRGRPKLGSIEADTGNFAIRESNNNQPNAIEYSVNLKRLGGIAVDDVNQQVSLSASSNIWPLVSMGNSFGHLNTNSNFGPQLLSPGYPVDQRSGLIDLEYDNEGVRNNMWHKQSHNGSFTSLYPIGQNELQHPHYFKAPDTFSYHQREPKLTPFDFEQLQASSSVSVGRGQYFGKLGEQQHPNMHMPIIDLTREKSLNDNIIRERIFSSERFGYNMPPMQQDLAPLQPCFDFGELVQNRASGNDRTLGGWSNLESSSHVPGISRSNIDESLYGVVPSQFRNNNNNNNNTELPYAAPFNLVQGFGSSSVYSGDLLSAQEPSSSAPLVKNSNHLLVRSTGSTDTPLQRDSALQDSMIKPFLRPWNS